MGIGPVPALRAALKKAKLTLGDMARIEVIEAFAVQYLSVEKELSLDRDIIYVNGGVIAIGTFIQFIFNSFKVNRKALVVQES